MRIKRRFMPFFAAIAAVASSTALAASLYVTPWYANPTLWGQVSLGSDSFVPVDMALAADGTRLVVACEASGSFSNLRVMDVERIDRTEGANAANVNSNAYVTAKTSSSFGIGDAPLLAASGASFLGIDTSTGAATAFPLASRNWVDRYAPTAQTFSTAPDATSFDFDSNGALWSNATGTDRTGLLSKRTLSGTTYSEAETVDTGLDAVDAVAVYTVNGTEYAFAAASGAVVRVNISTKEVYGLLEDATNLNASVKAVRMSHTDYFRPRLYVLLETGDMAVYYLNETASTATWSKNLTNSELLAVAGSQYAANEATVCAFEVLPDGGTAYAVYKVNENVAVNGTSFMAVIKNTPPRWRYYAADEPGNPTPDRDHCITDGHWVLWCRLTGDKNAVYGIGRNRNATDRAWANDYMGEILDLSAGCAFTSNNTKLASIWGNYNYSLGTNSFGLQPRVIIHSTTIYNNGNDQVAFDDVCKGWGFVEEVVLQDSPRFTKRGKPWGGLSKNVKRLVMDLPKLTRLDRYNVGTTDTRYTGLGSASDFSDINLPALQYIGQGAFGYLQHKGALDLPSVVAITNDAFRGCDNMTAANLSAQKQTLEFIGNTSFSASASGAGHMKRVTLGCAEGCILEGANIFRYQPLEDVVISGAVPTFTDTTAWPDTAANAMVFAVPRGVAAWDAIINDNTKVKSLLTDAQKSAFAAEHPGRPVPFGVVDKSVFHTKYDQYIAYNETALGGGCTLTIDRDTFFDDEVEVTSDAPACEDGTYVPGTTITLTASPNATGTFRKWYGDIPRTNLAMRTSATISFTITEDTWLYARFVHPWTLASDKKTACNGNFTINCSVVNASARTLKAGSEQRAGFYASNDTGCGILDLGGPIYLEGDATPWTFASIQGNGKTWIAELSGKGNASGLITPGTIVNSGPGGQFLHGGGSPLGQSYKMVIIDEPDMPWPALSGWAMCNNMFLTRLIIEAPNLLKLSGDSSFWSVPFSDTKFDWWDLSGVTTIAEIALRGYNPTGGGDMSYGGSAKAPASGTLSLPSMRGANTTGLSQMANVEGFSIGGADKATTVTNICAGAFGSDSSLNCMTLHAAADIAVGTNPFSSAAYTPKEFVFTGPAPASETALANLLSRVAAAETKPVKIYASTMQDGWTTASYIDYAPTAEERAEAPDERVIGVYRGGATSPSGKALVIFRRSRFDAPATIVIIR